MKNYYILFILLLVINTSCLKDNELIRDNPYDAKGQIDEKLKVRILNYGGYKVICKQKGDKLIQYPDDNSIYAGEHVWLYITLVNKGPFTINKIRSKISSDDKYIKLTPLELNYYLTFVSSDYVSSKFKSDTIASFDSGWSQISNGVNTKLAPNYSAYAVEFTVDSLAKTGSKIKFNIASTDNIGNKWNDDFYVTIN